MCTWLRFSPTKHANHAKTNQSSRAKTKNSRQFVYFVGGSFAVQLTLLGDADFQVAPARSGGFQAADLQYAAD
jgi:hypothetical protein